MNTPAEIIDTIGPEIMSEKLGVKMDRVTRARRAEKLPSLWFDFCERHLGKPLSRKLFTFK